MTREISVEDEKRSKARDTGEKLPNMSFEDEELREVGVEEEERTAVPETGEELTNVSMEDEELIEVSVEDEERSAADDQHQAPVHHLHEGHSRSHLDLAETEMTFLS